MPKIYLDPQMSEELRPHLNTVTPYSTDLQELLTKGAAFSPDEQVGRDSLDLLHRQGYLGLPKMISRALIEALYEIRHRLNPLIPVNLCKSLLFGRG